MLKFMSTFAAFVTCISQKYRKGGVWDKRK